MQLDGAVVALWKMIKREGFGIRHRKIVIWCYPSWYL